MAKKYSKKEIIKGFYEWDKHFRLKPSEFKTDLETLSNDLINESEEKAKVLIKYINKNN